MRVAVTGMRGQLVRCLQDRAAAFGATVIAIGRPQLDLGRPESIAPALRDAQPDVVVNAAAITAVDDAEDNPQLAQAVNAEGAGHVAAAAAVLGVPVIHVSTDYVFDGRAGRPYAEDDATNPLSVYGRTKLEGERLVAGANPDHIVLRTAWVYSPFGTNFLPSTIKAARTKDILEVPSEQFGSPTSGLDLADAILHAASRLIRGEGARGIFHFAGRGSTNRANQARHILAASKARGGPFADVKDVASPPARAPRPRDSRLSSERFAATFGWLIPDWRSSTDAAVAQLLSAEERP